jgi:adenosine deaminase CECR1
MQGLIRFAPIWAEYIREFFVTSIDDGISYVEARINFLFKYATSVCSQHQMPSSKLHYRYMVGANGQEDIPHRDWIQMFGEIINEVKKDMKKKGREDEFIGARV